MTWVLILMTCNRFCTPQYAETYPSQEACMAKVPESRFLAHTTRYCVPLIKEAK